MGRENIEKKISRSWLEGKDTKLVMPKRSELQA